MLGIWDFKKFRERLQETFVSKFHTRVKGLQPIENVHDTAWDPEYLA